MLNREIEINGVKIGPDRPVYIIAELSGNHNGDINRALRLIDKAKEAGASAVKLQTYTADTITINHDAEEFKINDGLWKGRNLYELYQEAHTPWNWHAELFNYANSLGMTIFSAPFDISAVDFLEELGCPAYKIASPEIIDLGLIEKVASTGKPMIISTGMATEKEISEAYDTAIHSGAEQIALLHCVSSYPTSYHDANIATIEDIASKYSVPVGLSDHTESTFVSTLSVARGASIIEKHLTLKRSDGGVDSAFSLEPQEFSKLVEDVNLASCVVGKPSYGPLNSEKTTLLHRRSLYVVKDIKKGEKFTNENIRSIRPAKGLKPKLLPMVLNSIAKHDIKYGMPLSEDMIQTDE